MSLTFILNLISKLTRVTILDLLTKINMIKALENFIIVSYEKIPFFLLSMMISFLFSVIFLTTILSILMTIFNLISFYLLLNNSVILNYIPCLNLNILLLAITKSNLLNLPNKNAPKDNTIPTIHPLCYLFPINIMIILNIYKLAKIPNYVPKIIKYSSPLLPLNVLMVNAKLRLLSISIYNSFLSLLKNKPSKIVPITKSKISL